MVNYELNKSFDTDRSDLDLDLDPHDLHNCLRSDSLINYNRSLSLGYVFTLQLFILFIFLLIFYNTVQ